MMHKTAGSTETVSRYTRRFILVVSSFFVLPLVANSAYAHHGPKWIELDADGIRIVAADDDNDAIFNWREEMLGTAPDNADSDGDGFNDLFEDNYRAFGFDPLKRNQDSDRDGLADRLEIELGTAIDLQDTDADHFSDFDEVMNERFGYDPLKQTADLDFDGLTDGLERTLETSRRAADSNGDGINDFEAYYEGINPLGIFEGHFGEIIGTTYSSRMEEAIARMRSGEAFPAELAVELPYPAVTRGLYGPAPRDDPGAGDTQIVATRRDEFISPSAALLQSGVAANAGIPYITALYPTYNQIVAQLRDVASAFDGSPNSNIVRLFYWSEPTEGHRSIYALKISDNPGINEDETEMLFMGLHHGRELISASYALRLISHLTNGYTASDFLTQARVNGAEIWIIPVVNPDGYAMAQSEFVLGANVKWRKNIRKVLEQNTSGGTQTDMNKGVDPNRNYDFTHIRTLSPAQRAALGQKTCEANGLEFFCNGFITGNSTYAGGFGFSDVEARSVRMLADDQFVSGHEIDGLRCSLSWHTGAPGDIISPLNHDPLSQVTVSPQDETRIDKLGEAYAAATGFFYNPVSAPWWQIMGRYQSFGTSDDWLYTHNGILPLTVEGYPHTSGPDFFAETAQGKSDNVARNMKGTLAFMDTCAPLRTRRSP